MANDYTGTYTGIQTGGPMKAADVTAALNKMEKVAYKVTELAASSTDTQYPSARAVYTGLAAKANTSDMTTALATKENISNKKTTISSTSDTEYPTSRAVSTALSLKEDASNKKTTISNSSTDTEYPSAKAVSTALAAKAEASAVTTLSTSIASLSFFPKGTILMYDGTSWTDNVTLKGWYKCEGQTVEGYGTLPNLKNRFVIGYDSANTPQRSKDNNSIKLTSDNIPRHTHDAHTGKFSIGDDDTDIATGNDVTMVLGTTGSFSAERRYTNTNRAGWGSYSAKGAGYASADTVVLNATHSYFGKSNSDGNPDAFDNRPSYYALIYIIKVTAAGA
ncbi:MAG: hypothetical protein LBQ83_08230 [Candidatus Margulisbacteria bacterium]|jgi:hypothetical protein|nr:hypothetical protein [Candidatus Margulisiibacteriota bacterium]